MTMDAPGYYDVIMIENYKDYQHIDLGNGLVKCVEGCDRCKDWKEE